MNKQKEEPGARDMSKRNWEIAPAIAIKPMENFKLNKNAVLEKLGSFNDTKRAFEMKANIIILKKRNSRTSYSW